MKEGREGGERDMRETRQKRKEITENTRRRRKYSNTQGGKEIRKLYEGKLKLTDKGGGKESMSQ